VSIRPPVSLPKVFKQISVSLSSVLLGHISVRSCLLNFGASALHDAQIKLHALYQKQSWSCS
jgi:hypothetical protein